MIALPAMNKTLSVRSSYAHWSLNPSTFVIQSAS